MPGRQLAAVSVDLDSLPHYCRIHGLPEAVLDARARALAYAVALPRFLALAAEAGVPLTLFAIGEDLTGPDAAAAGARAALATAAAGGCEVGNHSFGHDYALSRRAPTDIDRELAQGEEAIRAAVGTAPVGFRAPGYTLSPALYAALEARGYAYDSSTFPAAPYWAAKACVMGALALVGRPSRAVLDSPRVLAAPRAPYRPDPHQPYARGAGTVLELPVAMSPLARLPFIGTFAATLPEALLAPAFRGLTGPRAPPLFNFELHAVDLLDVSDGVPPALAAHQRDLRVPVALKRRRLLGWLRRLAAGAEPVTLAEAARRLAPAA